MHRALLIFILQFLLVFPFVVSAQNEWQSKLSKQSCFYHGQEWPYRLYLPDSIGEQDSLPIVLFLHGAGERGSDNELQLLHGVKYFMNDDFLRQNRFIFIAPQCPTDARWVEVDWSLAYHKMPRISMPLQAAFSLIDSLISVWPVDTNRIYVTGLSMGGFGTWDAISRRPEFFAAAMPVCGGGDESQACLLTGIPIKAFHGKLDHLVIPARTINMVNAVNLCGGKAESILFSNLGHLCWEKVYSDRENLLWLFQQRKQK